MTIPRKNLKRQGKNLNKKYPDMGSESKMQSREWMMDFILAYRSVLMNFESAEAQ